MDILHKSRPSPKRINFEVPKAAAQSPAKFDQTVLGVGSNATVPVTVDNDDFDDFVSASVPEEMLYRSIDNPEMSTNGHDPENEDPPPKSTLFTPLAVEVEDDEEEDDGAEEEPAPPKRTNRAAVLRYVCRALSGFVGYWLT